MIIKDFKRKHWIAVVFMMALFLANIYLGYTTDGQYLYDPIWRWRMPIMLLLEVISVTVGYIYLMQNYEKEEITRKEISRFVLRIILNVSLLYLAVHGLSLIPIALFSNTISIFTLGIIYSLSIVFVLIFDLLKKYFVSKESANPLTFFANKVLILLVFLIIGVVIPDHLIFLILTALAAVASFFSHKIFNIFEE